MFVARRIATGLVSFVAPFAGASHGSMTTTPSHVIAGHHWRRAPARRAVNKWASHSLSAHGWSVTLMLSRVGLAALLVSCAIATGVAFYLWRQGMDPGAPLYAPVEWGVAVPGTIMAFFVNNLLVWGLAVTLGSLAGLTGSPMEAALFGWVAVIAGQMLFGLLGVAIARLSLRAVRIAMAVIALEILYLSITDWEPLMLLTQAGRLSLFMALGLYAWASREHAEVSPTRARG